MLIRTKPAKIQARLVFEHSASIHGGSVENLAQIAFDMLKAVYHNRYGRALALSKITLYETPNCWAEINDDSING